ncbi:MAG TPA: DUF4011 domain-containing protein [Methanocorpusculum sp.]|nr:DUF4011 domain-containing protein [Methanocorpusculum sp.]
MANKTTVLEELRGRLLDLSLRNNLLNYHVQAARSIEITDSHVSEVYSTLVQKEKTMKFQPGENSKDTASPEEKNIWKYPIFSRGTKNTEQILNTPYSDIELRKRLYSLQTKSRTVFEEQGYPILYLALGFVEWDDPANKGLKAPLLLIPVDLIRKNIRENYTLSWSGEDPVVSPSLAAKLAEEGIALPGFGHPESREEVAAFFETVQTLIQQRGWKLLPGVILDLFSFKKYVMYKDLDPESWGEGFSIEGSTLIKSIFSADEHTAPSGSGEPVKSLDFSNIMDADSSQLAVIAEAKTGTNLVVEGPPGTGKSQTIANMIAEMLASGKSVLFVSEKMAALQVVKRRLDAAGLSRFLLELHSQNAKKTDFLHELESCLMMPFETGDASPDADTRAKIETLSSDLSGYCEELKTPVGACGFTPYDLFGIREQYRYEFEEKRRTALPYAPVEDAVHLTADGYRAAVAALTDIVSYLPTLLREEETIFTHPWAGSSPGRLRPAEREELRALAVTFRDNMQEVHSLIQNTAASAELPFVPKNETGLVIFTDTCREIGKAYPITREVLENPAWQNKAAAEQLVSRSAKNLLMKRTVDELFTPDIAAKDVSALYQEYLKVSGKGALSRIFSSKYKDVRAEVISCLRNPDLPDAEIRNGLQQAKIYFSGREGWDADKAACEELFSPVWNGDDTDPDLLQDYMRWIYILRSWLREGRITSATVDRLIAGKTEGCASAADELKEKYETAMAARSDLMARLHITEEKEPEFEELLAAAGKWAESIERIESWGRFLSYTDAAKNTAACHTAELVRAGKLEADAIIPSFVVGYIDDLLKAAYEKRPRLAQFAQMPHEQKIETFKALDRQIISENAKQLSRKLSKQMPELFAGASRESEMGILAGEFNRKRGHMSIRSLMTKCGGLIQKIKPCFMMSPLSVAQYLDPRSVTFDIIIFDEASQVKPEDALGALMRGRQLVVMGDSRQLPPTSFFDSTGGLFDEENDFGDGTAEITDMESLLHACKQVYPTRRLTWHYRSRHESLIAVSNAEFYDGSLFVFPSPKHDTDDLGLSFVHVDGSVYDRGKTGVNRGEAKEVARAVIEYYRRFPDKTLGVATFSSKQQEAIRREVDILLRDSPDVEALMQSVKGEEFFVKNLETVQGDERDTILISIGYGFDGEHKLSRNFGPLNQAGGERRLNVLITRARERCVVFSNFRGYELPLGEETPRGVCALASFLIYAESRNSDSLEAVSAAEPASDRFSDTIAEMLESRGYAVTRNVGCAGFRIDIAVAHPTEPGVFMAGILSDGRNYWSAADARDRDRLRLQILEGLGWNIIRVWAPEWFCAPKECERKLLQALEEAKTGKSKSGAAKKKGDAESVKKPAAEATVRDEEPLTQEKTTETGPEVIREKPAAKRTVRKKAEKTDIPAAAAEKTEEKEEHEDLFEPVQKPAPKRVRKPAQPAASAAGSAAVPALYHVPTGPVETPKDKEGPREWRRVPAEMDFPKYVAAKQCILQKYNQFASVQDYVIGTAIVEITAVEGPLSENTLYSRIKELGRVPRLTPAIKDTISRQVREVTADGQLERDDEGFISIPDGELIPRVRGAGWVITDVSLPELLLAAQIILMRQYATPKAELAKQTVTSLGFKATAVARERAEKAVNMGIRLGIITEEDGVCTVKS